VVRQQEKKSSGFQAGIDTGNDTDVLASAPLVAPMLERQNEIRMTYQNYVKAQKVLLSAFKEQEQCVGNAYKNNERRYQAYEEIVDRAFKNREQADTEALELYRKTVEEAGAAYRETIKNTLLLYKRTTDQAWQSSIEACEPRKHSYFTGFQTSVSSIGHFLPKTANNLKVKFIGIYQRIEMHSS
jgi:hypothetical protein